MVRKCFWQQFDALFQYNFYSKNRDTKLLPVAWLQMTSVGKNHHHNKQPHHMEIHCCWCRDRNRGWQREQRWIEGKTSNSQAMQTERLTTSVIGRRVMRLFSKACSIHRGESWKIPLSVHPTQSECVFTQPPGDPVQTSPDRWIHSRTEGTPEEQSPAEAPLSYSAWGKPSLILSLWYGPLRWRCWQTQGVWSHSSSPPKSMFGFDYRLCMQCTGERYLLMWVTVSCVCVCITIICTSMSCYKPSET